MKCQKCNKETAPSFKTSFVKCRRCSDYVREETRTEDFSSISTNSLDSGSAVEAAIDIAAEIVSSDLFSSSSDISSSDSSWGGGSDGGDFGGGGSSSDW